MADIDLTGVFFRAYYPGLEIEDEEYTPLGPGDYPDHDGAVDLGVIKFRAWEENDLELLE